MTALRPTALLATLALLCACAMPQVVTEEVIIVEPALEAPAGADLPKTVEPAPLADCADGIGGTGCPPID